MHFTVIFKVSDYEDWSYGLIWAPCPVWVRGDIQLAIPTRGPVYKRGGVRMLLDHEKVQFKPDESPRRVTVLVHAGGHVQTEDLAALEADLAGEGFDVLTVDATGRERIPAEDLRPGGPAVTPRGAALDKEEWLAQEAAARQERMARLVEALKRMEPLQARMKEIDAALAAALADLKEGRVTQEQHNARVAELSQEQARLEGEHRKVFETEVRSMYE